MLEEPEGAYPVEFTVCRHHSVPPAPTPEDLIVCFCPRQAGMVAALPDMELAGFKSVPSLNPYWENNGRTFADHDGYRIVLQRGRWDWRAEWLGGIMLAPGKVTAREPLMEVFRSPLRFLLPLGGVALPAAARASSCEDSFAQKGNPLSGNRFQAEVSIDDLTPPVAIRQRRGIAAAERSAGGGAIGGAYRIDDDIPRSYPGAGRAPGPQSSPWVSGFSE
jgi:hypothetical protein